MKIGFVSRRRLFCYFIIKWVSEKIKEDCLNVQDGGGYWLENKVTIWNMFIVGIEIKQKYSILVAYFSCLGCSFG